MTAGEIETLLRKRVMEAAPPITGKVYFKDMRPRQNDNDLHLEDCEVAVLTGTGSEQIEGTCTVNVWVPDTLTSSGIYMKSKRRTDAIEAWMTTLPPIIRDGRIYFQRDGIIATLKEQDTNEHFVSLKMRFKVLVNNY